MEVGEWGFEPSLLGWCRAVFALGRRAGLGTQPEGTLQPRGTPRRTPGMVETKDLVQLRQLNLALLKQLWAGQDAVRRSVAKAASKVSTHLENSQGRRGSGCPTRQVPGLLCNASSLEKTEAQPRRDWPGTLQRPEWG